MTERWGTCKICKGWGSLNSQECGACGGTGYDGAVYDAEWRSKEKTLKFTPQEQMEHAIFAFEKELEK